MTVKIEYRYIESPDRATFLAELNRHGAESFQPALIEVVNGHNTAYVWREVWDTKPPMTPEDHLSAVGEHLAAIHEAG